MPQRDLEYLISEIGEIPKDVLMPLYPNMKNGVIEFMNVKRIDRLIDLNDDKFVLRYNPLPNHNENKISAMNYLLDSFSERVKDC